MSNLALDLRPTKLSEILGQPNTVRAIQSFIDKGNFPNVFLFYGPPGTGKTTLAQIVAEAAGGTASCIHEINGSTDNKVENARALEEMAQSVPLDGGRRVFILNEFHRFTDAAQDALKEPMEKTPALWIITTDQPDKISDAILSRAKPATFKLNLLGRAEIETLAQRTGITSCGCDAVSFLWDHEIRAPREILGVIDQFMNGVPLEEAIHGSEHEPLYPEVAAAVLSGNWTKTANLLKQIKTADYRAMVAVVSAKLSWALLDEGFGTRADALAVCLVGLGVNQFADGVAYASLKALLYKCCKALGVK